MPDVTPLHAIPFAIPADNVADYPATSEDLANRVEELLPRTIIKPTSETVVSSVTVQNDDALFFAVEANAVYVLDVVLLWESHAASGIFTEWASPAGTTFTGASLINDAANTGVGAGELTRHKSWVLEAAPACDTVGAGIGTMFSIVEHYLIETAGTAGTVQLTWAQSVSNATLTRLKLGSYLVVRRVA